MLEYNEVCKVPEFGKKQDMKQISPALLFDIKFKESLRNKLLECSSGQHLHSDQSKPEKRGLIVA